MAFKTLLEKVKWINLQDHPIIHTAKWYGSSAVDFIWKQLTQTPIFIHTEEEYNILMSEKRAICIAYDNREPIRESIHLMLPIWSTQAWADTAVLRYIELSGHPDLAQQISIDGPLEMRISYMGEEQYRFNNIEDIQKWWKDRTYKNPEKQPTETSEEWSISDTHVRVDPLW